MGNLLGVKAPGFLFSETPKKKDKSFSKKFSAIRPIFVFGKKVNNSLDAHKFQAQ